MCAFFGNNCGAYFQGFFIIIFFSKLTNIVLTYPIRRDGFIYFPDPVEKVEKIYDFVAYFCYLMGYLRVLFVLFLLNVNSAVCFVFLIFIF